MGECWHVVITLPKHGEKLNLQTTIKTQKPPCSAQTVSITWH